MKDEIKGQLTSLFAQDKRKAEVAVQEKLERDAQAETNDAEFSRIRNAVILPAMREMSEFIIAQGWDSDISIEERQSGNYGQASPARITMTFFRGSKPAYYQQHDHPHVGVVHSQGSAGVWFPTSTIMPGRGGSSSSGAGVLLPEVTAEMVQGYIANVLSRVLKGAP